MNNTSNYGKNLDIRFTVVGGFFMNKKIWVGRWSTLQKRLFVSIVSAIALLIIVVVPWLMGRVFKKDVGLSEVFQNSQIAATNSSLEIAGQYVTKHLSKEDRIEVLTKITDAIGLNVITDDFIEEQDNKVETLTVHKKSKVADTRIQMVSMNTNADGEIPIVQNYIMVRLQLSDQIASILGYKKIVENCFDRMKMTGQSSYVQLVGRMPGDISLESKNKMTDQMIQELGGKIMYENRENPMYTVYGYTGGIPEYISVGRSKVNIQIAMNYNEAKDETMVYLATPILNGSY